MAKPIFVEIIGNASQFKKELEGAVASTNKANSGFSRMSKAAGVAGLALAGGLAVGFDKSVKAAMSFQEQMALVQTQAGGTAADVKTLSAGILDLATKTTQGPVELAKAMFHLKSLGLDNVDAMKALKTSSQAATMGMADLESTTNVLGGAIRSGIRGAGDFSTAMGTLNAAIGAGNMRMDDLTGALSTGILPTAKSAGLSLRDVTSVLADFTRQGIPAEQAATRFRTALIMMINPSSKASSALKEVGLNGTMLGRAMRGPEGIVGAIKLLRDHFEQIHDPVQRFQLETAALGGSKTASTIITLMNSVGNLGQIYDQVGGKAGQFNKLAQAAADEPANKLKQMSSTWKALEIEIGTALIPVMEKATQVFQTLGGFLASHATLAKVLAAGLAVLATAMLGASAAAFIMTNAMTLGIAAAITVLIAGVVLLVRHWGTVKEKMMEVAGWIEGTFLGAWEDVKGALIGVKNWIAAHWPEIVTLISGPFAPLVGLATNAFGVRSAMEDALRALKNFASARVDEIAGFFTALPGKIGAAISAGAGAIKKSITDLFGKVIGWVKDVLGIGSPSTVFHEIGQHVIQGFINGVGSMAGVLGDVVKKLATGLLPNVGQSGTGGLRPTPGTAPSSGGSNQAIGRQLAAGYGWGGGQWDALVKLWNQESGWNNFARNPSSGAYGIPQALPESKLPAAGRASGGSNPAAQIGWGLSYIHGRYGSPLAAWAHEQRFNWYGDGGIFTSPSIIGVGEKGPEAVVPLNRLGGGDTYVVNIPNYVGDKRDLVDIVTRELYRLQKRNGTTGIK